MFNQNSVFLCGFSVFLCVIKKRITQEITQSDTEKAQRNTEFFRLTNK